MRSRSGDAFPRAGSPVQLTAAITAATTTATAATMRDRVTTGNPMMSAHHVVGT
jgi:hypothetical protein